jgi:hypothetical protein
MHPGRSFRRRTASGKNDEAGEDHQPACHPERMPKRVHRSNLPCSMTFVKAASLPGISKIVCSFSLIPRFSERVAASAAISKAGQGRLPSAGIQAGWIE